MGNKPKIKTPELIAAKKALIAYFKEHNLNPSDRTLMNDPVHGKTLTDLVNKLNKERDKVMANYPAADRSNNLKLLKMAKKEKEAKKAKKVEETTSEKKKKSTGRTTTKYDYPQVKDEKTGKMRDMTSDEKKKFRVEARKKANGGDAKPKKEKKVEAPKPKKEEKVKDKKKDKKKAKAKKEED